MVVVVVVVVWWWWCGDGGVGGCGCASVLFVSAFVRCLQFLFCTPTLGESLEAELFFHITFTHNYSTYHTYMQRELLSTHTHTHTHTHHWLGLEKLQPSQLKISSFLDYHRLMIFGKAGGKLHEHQRSQLSTGDNFYGLTLWTICVCVCARAHAHVCVHACMCVCVCVRAFVHACAHIGGGISVVGQVSKHGA